MQYVGFRLSPGSSKISHNSKFYNSKPSCIHIKKCQVFINGLETVFPYKCPEDFEPLSAQPLESVTPGHLDADDAGRDGARVEADADLDGPVGLVWHGVALDRRHQLERHAPHLRHVLLPVAPRQPAHAHVRVTSTRTSKKVLAVKMKIDA